MRSWYPGAFFPEEGVIEVDNRDTRPDDDSRAYAFEFFDRECVEANGEILLGARKNESPRYFFGEELTAAQALKGASEILKSNIEGNGYKRLVRTKRGQIFPLGANDEVLK